MYHSKCPQAAFSAYSDPMEAEKQPCWVSFWKCSMQTQAIAPGLAAFRANRHADRSALCWKRPISTIISLQWTTWKLPPASNKGEWTTEKGCCSYWDSMKGETASSRLFRWE